MLPTEIGVVLARLERDALEPVTFDTTDENGAPAVGTVSWDEVTEGEVWFEVGLYKVLHMQPHAPDAFGDRFAMLRGEDGAIVVVETHRYRATVAQEKP